MTVPPEYASSPGSSGAGAARAACASAPGLRELQREFGAALLEGLQPGGAGHASVRARSIDGLEPLALDIYRQTCRSTLTAALATSFPAVRQLVGENFFEGCAGAFIAEHAPASACLNDYGDEFASFLRAYVPAAGLVYLADVARLERAFNRALHAVDEAPGDFAALASLSPAEAASIQLVPHPALSVLQLDYPAERIWRAVLDEDEAGMAAIDLDEGPRWVLVERRPDGVEVRRMSEAVARFTQRLIEGHALQSALEAAATGRSGACEPLDAVLADHLTSGRFIAWRLAPGSPATGESSA